MRNKIVDAAEAVAIIRSGDTVASSGFVGVGTPDEIIKALERRFVQTGEPRDLTLVFAAAPGDGLGPGAQSSRSSRPDQAFDRRPLWVGAETGANGRRQSRRGLQFAAGMHFASVSRDCGT